MRPSRSPVARFIAARVVSLPLAALALAACTDSQPTAPRAPSSPAPLASVRMSCAVDRAARRATCTPTVAPSASLSGRSSVRADVVLPAGAVQLVLVFGANAYNSGTGTLSVSVSVRDTTDHAIGTADGTTPTGVKVFYTELPHVTAGSGSVTVLNADGVGNFTAPGQLYYGYSEMVAAHGESSAKLWKWRLSSDVQTWQFDLAVAANVPDMQGPPVRTLTWLPPLGTGSADSATFDTAANPVVEICAWTGTACSGAPLARFTTSAAGSENSH